MTYDVANDLILYLQSVYLDNDQCLDNCKYLF